MAVCVSPSVGASDFDRGVTGTLLSKPQPCLVLQLGGSSWSTKGSSRIQGRPTHGPWATRSLGWL